MQSKKNETFQNLIETDSNECATTICVRKLQTGKDGMDLKMFSAVVNCCMQMLTSRINFGKQTSSVDPD